MAKLSERGKIVSLTETHLIKDQHYKEEITDYLPNFNMARTDRDIKFDPTDEKALKSRGGTLILGSPDICFKEVGKYCVSNGNCELSVAELTELKLAVLTVYRPSGINYSLDKFKDILSKVKTYLSGLRETNPDYKIVLTGDFNFNSKIVKWIRTEEGLCPDASEGHTDLHRGFQLLSDLAIEFGLEQVVDKPTREREILDLVYTDTPEIVLGQSVEYLMPSSDHNLITLDLELGHDPTGSAQGNEQDQYGTEIKQFDWKLRDETAFSEALSRIDWENRLTHDQVVNGNGNRLFEEALVEAAIASNVPKNRRRRGKVDVRVDQLLGRKRKIEKAMEGSSFRASNLDNAKKRVIEINRKIQGYIASKQEKEEERIIKDIKTNTKAFFKYANRKKKGRSTIGPLKNENGVGFERDSKRMAQMLSDQYKSVFSTPKEDFSDFHLPAYDFEELDDIEITEDGIREAD